MLGHMWMHRSRVIWLCLTKQHSQTPKKFLLLLISHHWHRGGMKGDRQRQNKREREIMALREEAVLQYEAKYDCEGDIIFQDRKKKSIYGSRHENRALLEWKVHDHGPALDLVVPQRPELPRRDWLLAWVWDAWLAVAHSIIWPTPDYILINLLIWVYWRQLKQC